MQPSLDTMASGATRCDAPGSSPPVQQSDLVATSAAEPVMSSSPSSSESDGPAPSLAGSSATTFSTGASAISSGEEAGDSVEKNGPSAEQLWWLIVEFTNNARHLVHGIHPSRAVSDASSDPTFPLGGGNPRTTTLLKLLRTFPNEDLFLSLRGLVAMFRYTLNDLYVNPRTQELDVFTWSLASDGSSLRPWSELIPLVVTIVGATELWLHAPPDVKEYAAEIKETTRPRVVEADFPAEPMDEDIVQRKIKVVVLEPERHPWQQSGLHWPLFHDWWNHVGHLNADLYVRGGTEPLSLQDVINHASSGKVPSLEGRERFPNINCTHYVVADFLRRLLDMAYGLGDYGDDRAEGEALAKFEGPGKTLFNTAEYPLQTSHYTGRGSSLIDMDFSEVEEDELPMYRPGGFTAGYCTYTCVGWPPPRHTHLLFKQLLQVYIDQPYEPMKIFWYKDAKELQMVAPQPTSEALEATLAPRISWETDERASMEEVKKK